MKEYYAYTRVSTVRQGEKGSSLQEQKDAICRFAHRQGLTITQWFEETETAAKQGRREFARLMSALSRGKASGLVLHKIDRGARNLWDWARIQDLIEEGIEVHFAHESLDLTSRGGRLSADIQAVVATDYIRNLRDEVRKGILGRLKQGIYPFAAPIGYRDCGGGKPKEIDPVTGPLVRLAFELYATGHYSFDTLREELYRRGLARRSGQKLYAGALTTILRNPFYIGLIRIRRHGATYSGIHKPLIDPAFFRRVQDVLDGKHTAWKRRHAHLYRRMLKCGYCDRSLTGEIKKGHTYYRCHTKGCETKCIREEAVKAAIHAAVSPLAFSEAEMSEMKPLLADYINDSAARAEAVASSLKLQLAHLKERLARLTDAYLDQVVDRAAYEERRALLLHGQADLETQEKASPSDPNTSPAQKLEKYFELARTLRLSHGSPEPEEIRQILFTLTSNLRVLAKNVVVELREPYARLTTDLVARCGGPRRDGVRTLDGKCIDVLARHLDGWEPPDLIAEKTEKMLKDAQEAARRKKYARPIKMMGKINERRRRQKEDGVVGLS